MIQLVIFDCDGVLFDSRPANVAFHNAVLERLGQPLLDTAGEDLGHFLAADQLYDHLFGPATPLRARASEIAHALDYAPFYEFMRPVDGLFEVLDGLHQRYELAMASNRARTARGVAERFGLDRYLRLVVGTRDVPRPKPAPDMLELCMQRLGVEPAATLFVGDAITDRDAAVAANVHFIGVGAHSGVDDPISDFRELPVRLAVR
jgi:HAD superfamily hydrolase (TIGR01509 family)